jgi:hypothetical protein
MKWIKTYNEAIGPKLTKKVYDEETGVTQSVSDVGMSPNTFRSASGIARSNKQITKAAELEDWGNIKEFGYYNMNIICINNRTVHNIPFTKCQISNVRWGVPMSGEDSSKLRDKNLNMEDLVDNWEHDNRNSTLGITFDVGFNVTNEGKSKLAKDGSSTDYWKKISESYGNDKLFSISIVFSDIHGIHNMINCRSCDGYGYWCCDVCEGDGSLWNDDDESVKCGDCDGKGEIPCPDCGGKKISNRITNTKGETINLEFDENGIPIYDVQSFFEDSKKLSLMITPIDLVSGSYTGFFADKKSAIEFTKDLPKLVNNNAQLNKMIRDLLSLLSHEPSEDLVEVMKAFGNISNNKLLPDKGLLNSSAQGLKNSGLFWKKITK